MRSIGFAMLSVMVLGWCSGCAQSAKEANLIGRYFYLGATQSHSMTQSSSEHLHSMQSIVDLDAKALLDDIDVFWQRDRGTRLTRWHER
jgi:hypothetical protein